MVDLEERHGHAERIHYFDTPRSVQWVKTKLFVVLISMELRYRHRQHQETDIILGLSYPEANRYVKESWHDQDNSLENGEMVSSTSVGRPHTIIPTIEETHASKPRAQSRLMNYFSKEFIQIDNQEVK